MTAVHYVALGAALAFTAEGVALVAWYVWHRYVWHDPSAPWR